MKYDHKVLDFLRSRAASYRLTFPNPTSHPVLKDLAKFCRVNSSVAILAADGSIDKEKTLIAIGRNEVWLRLQQHLNLSPTELYALYGGPEVEAMES
jgi:hypothetical protein